MACLLLIFSFCDVIFKLRFARVKPKDFRRLVKTLKSCWELLAEKSQKIP